MLPILTLVQVWLPREHCTAACPGPGVQSTAAPVLRPDIDHKSPRFTIHTFPWSQMNLGTFYRVLCLSLEHSAPWAWALVEGWALHGVMRAGREDTGRCGKGQGVDWRSLVSGQAMSEYRY